MIDFQNLECINKTHVLIMNTGQLSHTQNLINCLLIQDTSFDLTIIPNIGDEYTDRYYRDLKKFWPRKDCSLNIIQGNDNLQSDRIKWFYNYTTNPYLAILNNDIEICNNFISDAEKIFDLVPECGHISHPTNMSAYTKKEDLRYEIMNTYIPQYYDMIIRKDICKEIPEDISHSEIDFLFSKVYESDFKQVYDISSPMIYYNIDNISQTTSKYCKAKPNGIFPLDLTKKIIVSLTTWKKRIGNVHHIINLMLNQTRVPDKIILNVSEEEFNSDRNYVERQIDIQNPRFEINWVKGENTKNWKKFIPIIDKYPNDLIITIDDDYEYPEDYIEICRQSYFRNPYSPLTGMDNVWYGLHHCSDAFNMLQYKFIALYLPTWKDCYKYIMSNDTWNVYAHKLNGYDFRPTDKLFFGRLREYHSNDSFSTCIHKDDPNWTLNSYLWLIDKYGPIQDFDKSDTIWWNLDKN